MNHVTKFILSGVLAFSMTSMCCADTALPNPRDETLKGNTEEEPVQLISGNFDITTNYLFRGLSNSNNLPAFQGGLTLTFPPGLYLNIWGSNVSILDKNGVPATLEIDSLIGFANAIGDSFKYDINFARYNYPKAAGLNYNEWNSKFTFHFLVAQLSYSNNVYNSGKDGTYGNLGFNYTIPSKYFFNLNDFSVSGGVGYYSLPISAGLHSYYDYNLQLSKTIGAYILSVQWTDTSGAHAYPLDGSKLIGTVLVNF